MLCACLHIGWLSSGLGCCCVLVAVCHGSISYSYWGLCKSSYSRAFSRHGKPLVCFISVRFDTGTELALVRKVNT